MKPVIVSLFDTAICGVFQSAIWECTLSHSGCLVPEFFFCVMTDVMKGWQGDGFDAPGQGEWRLKGNRDAIRKNYPDMMEMILTMQNQGKLPRKWPSFFLINTRGTRHSSTKDN